MQQQLWNWGLVNSQWPHVGGTLSYKFNAVLALLLHTRPPMCILREQTVTHEIGHNFGAQHTFNSGGIMSYDNNPEFKFTGTNPAEVCLHVKVGSLPRAWGGQQLMVDACIILCGSRL